jgi:glutathione peroxidase
MALEVGLREVRRLLVGERYTDEVRADERTAGELGINAVPTSSSIRKLGAPSTQPEGLLDLLRQDGPSRAPHWHSPKMSAMAIFENLSALGGAPLDESALHGRTVLVVNVASRCGLTPQYTGLERLQERYSERGFTVLGVPCNQFGEQEPGSAEEIQTFCSTTYGVSFPMTEKLDVNGPERHPLYSTLAATTGEAGETGEAGDVQWNFEKFLVSADGHPVARFRPTVEPESQELTAAIESELAS